MVAPPTVRIPAILTSPTDNKLSNGLNTNPLLASIFNLWKVFVADESINVIGWDEFASVESTSMKFVFVDNPAVSANPDVAANVDIPAKSENVAKPALCEFVENPEIVATPAILAKVAIPAKSEKVANPALFASVADIEVVIVPVANPVTIKLLSMNTELLNDAGSSTVNSSSVVSPSTFKFWSKSTLFWTFKVSLIIAVPSTSSWLFAYKIPSTSKSLLILAAPSTSRGFVGFTILIPTFEVVWIPDPFDIQRDLISISNTLLPASVPKTISPPLRFPIRLIVVNEVTPMLTPSFRA